MRVLKGFDDLFVYFLPLKKNYIIDKKQLKIFLE